VKDKTSLKWLQNNFDLGERQPVPSTNAWIVQTTIVLITPS
jgi:hypothetical protein